MTIYDVDATELIEEVAKELKNIESIKPPEWAVFVKTGVHKERPPARADWWYVRTASVLRKIRLKGPIGVSKLRRLYGGKQSRGHKGEHFKKGSGNILRKILQQLEKAELIKQEKKGVHKGRVIIPKGIKIMDAAAKKLGGNRSIKKVEEPKEKPESKLPVSQTKPEKPKTTEEKTKKIVEKTKEFVEGKAPTAEKILEEVKKEDKVEDKKKPEPQPQPKKENNVPKELAKKNE